MLLLLVLALLSNVTHALVKELHGTAYITVLDDFQKRSHIERTVVLDNDSLTSVADVRASGPVDWLVNATSESADAQLIGKLRRRHRGIMLPQYGNLTKPASLLTVIVGFQSKQNGTVIWPSYLSCGVSTTCMVRKVNTSIFADVNRALHVSSLGRFVFLRNSTLITTAIIPFDVRQAQCYYHDWAVYAKKYLQSTAGVDTLKYTYQLFILPTEAGNRTACKWTGLAFVGCQSYLCSAWVRDIGTPGVYAHELGHLLGMGHASTDNNDDGTIDCEYCDTSCNMGNNVSSLKAYNAPQRLERGWIANVISDPPRDALLSCNNAVVVTREGVRYLLSLRCPIGLDAGTVIAPAVYIHRSSTSSPNSILIGKLVKTNSAFISRRLSVFVRHLNATSAIVNSHGDDVSCRSVPIRMSVSSSDALVVDVSNVYTCGSNSTVLIRASEAPSSSCGKSVVRLRAPCTASRIRTCRNISVLVVPDRFKKEIKWSLKLENTVIAKDVTDNEVSARACGTVGSKVTFFISDSYGDGLCCGYGLGSYTVWMDGEVVARGGAFSTNDTFVTALCPQSVGLQTAQLRLQTPYILNETTIAIEAQSRFGTTTQAIRLFSSCRSKSKTPSITVSRSKTASRSRSKRPKK